MQFVTEGQQVADIDPQPTHWPVCIQPRSRKDPEPCETPFVRRVGLSLRTGRHVWSWSPDCKHKISGGLDETKVRIEYQEPEKETTS